jgi:hypothetical protein
MRGRTANSILGIERGDGHAWVCDGAREVHYENYFFVEFIDSYYWSYSNKGYTSAVYPGLDTGAGYYYFNMNWGWGEGYNGWFYDNNVNTTNGNFQYERKNLFVYPK